MRLLGAAEKIFPEIRGTLLTVFRIETEEFIENARTVLGEAIFLGVYEEGKKMTLDQAVAYALAEWKSFSA